LILSTRQKRAYGILRTVGAVLLLLLLPGVLQSCLTWAFQSDAHFRKKIMHGRKFKKAGYSTYTKNSKAIIQSHKLESY